MGHIWNQSILLINMAGEDKNRQEIHHLLAHFNHRGLLSQIRTLFGKYLKLYTSAYGGNNFQYAVHDTSKCVW